MIVQTVICGIGISVIDDSVLFLAVLEPDGSQLVHTLATSDASDTRGSFQARFQECKSLLPR